MFYCFINVYRHGFHRCLITCRQANSPEIAETCSNERCWCPVIMRKSAVQCRVEPWRELQWQCCVSVLLSKTHECCVSIFFVLSMCKSIACRWESKCRVRGRGIKTWHRTQKKPTLKISSLNLLFLLAVLVFYSFFGKGKEGFGWESVGKRSSVFFRGRCVPFWSMVCGLLGRSERQIRALISEFRGPSWGSPTQVVVGVLLCRTGVRRLYEGTAHPRRAGVQRTGGSGGAGRLRS